MAYPGLVWQPLQLPFSAGLQQQTDDRARPQPFLDICKDAQHDVEVGGLVTRLPYAALSNSIFGGGTLANCRRLAVVNNELCVFTDTQLYSWNSELSKWILRGTHLAVEVNHERRLATNGDQTVCDRAELSGTVVYTWAEGSSLIWVAALSKATGAVLMVPTPVAGVQARVVALSTKILFFLHQTGGVGLTVRALDPADPATGFAAAATTIAAGMASTFDVVRVLGADQAVGACEMTTSTTYTAFTVTAGVVVATSLKARFANGHQIAVASRPSAGAQTHIFRVVTGSTAVQGDVLTTSTLADVSVNQPIGTYSSNPNYLTACYRSVQTAGHFVCAVFWNANYQATPSIAFDCKTNTVDDAGTIGTQATFVPGVVIASRAFDYAGSVYVNMLFSMFNQTTPAPSGPQLNNQYLLYKEDRTIHGKMVAPNAGSHDLVVALRPGVASLDGLTYHWAGTFRRTATESTTPTSGISAPAKLYGARSLVDISITFDSNAARRTRQLGRTLYISGSELLQYDGVRLVEVGFNVFQYALDMADGGAATGSVAAGSYSLKSTYSYTNSQGEFERSTTGAIESISVAAGSSSITSVGGVIGPLYTTRKSATPPSVEVWRTTVNPITDAPYYLATSLDSTASSNPNRYLANATSGISTFVDALADATLSARLANPENGGFLETLAPPSATIVAASDTRLVLGGVAGDPDRVWPSRTRNDGEIASFHDGLPVDVPSGGGDITAIWFQDETMYVSRQTALYVLPGDGVDNLGQGQGFGPARIVSLDVGAVSQESVALTPHGTIFLSRKGWQLLDRGGVLQHIGGPVSDYNSETVCSVDVVETQHQVRILTTARMLVWAYPRPDFPGGQWGEWTISDGVHSLMWNGTHVYLTATGPKQQQTTYTSLTYGQDVEEAWIKPNGLVGSAKVRRLQPLGEYRSAFLLRMRIAYNYDPTYIDDVVWTPSPTTVGGPLQMMHAPSRPRCESIKVRLTAVTDSVRATLATAPLFVTTSGTVWTATWTAGASLPGELGNALTMTLSFEDWRDVPGATAPSIAVRDNMRFNPLDGRAEWVAAPRNLGVRVLLDQAAPVNNPTIAQLEAAIVAGATLATLTSADATPGKKLDSGLVGNFITGTFTGGVFGAPTGEALKLTGLGLEVGIEKANLYTGLARAQKA